MEKKTIYQKVFEAKSLIKSMKLEKKGYNEYSNYYYFTPEQIEEMVSKACIEQRLLTKFDLVRKDDGSIDGVLSVIDVDDHEQNLQWLMATDIPSIKATNVVQQLGGAMTFTERYLKQTAFGIMDNTLDFDSKKPESKPQPKKEEAPKPWLNRVDKAGNTTPQWEKLVQAVNEGKVKDVATVRKKYAVNKEVAKDIELLIEMQNV